MTTITPEGSKTIPTISIDTTTLYERLCKADEGEVITYTKLSELIDRDVQHEGSGNLTTARKKALREKGFVFECVRGIGIKRALPSEVVDASESGVKRARRQMRLSSRKLATVDTDSLSQEDQTRAAVLASKLATLELCSGSSKKIEQSVIDCGESIPATKCLELFIGAKTD